MGLVEVCLLFCSLWCLLVIGVVLVSSYFGFWLCMVCLLFLVLCFDLWGVGLLVLIWCWMMLGDLCCLIWVLLFF